MRIAFKSALVVCPMLMSTVAVAQLQPIPEAQLAKGFLGDQNARLIGQDAPANDAYSSRAAAALARADYSGALAILRPYRRTHDVAYHYLAGKAHEGLGDYASARRELAEALRRRRNFVGAQAALGLIEAQHGDKVGAEAILQDLTERRDRCGGACSQAAELTSAVASIEAALRLVGN